MYLVSLPAKITSGDKKGEDAFVDIKSAKLTQPDPQNPSKTIPVQFRIPQNQFQYPQFGPEPAKDEDGNYVELTEDQAQQGIDEAIQDAGGKIRFLENYNSATRTAALNTGKNYIRTKETGTIDEITSAGIKLAAEFSWAKAERLTNKEVRERVEDLAGKLDTMSGDQLKEALKKLFGK